MLGEIFLLKIFTQNFKIAGGPDAGGALRRRGRAFVEIAAVDAAPDGLLVSLERFIGAEI
jgi:hypothetical protein